MKITRFLSLIVALAMTTAGCISPGGFNLPPASRLLEPGPGVGGPGPGVIPPPGPDAIDPAGGGPVAWPASGAYTSEGGAVVGHIGNGNCQPPACMGGGGAVVMQQTVQVLFASPESVHVRWDVTGENTFDSEPLVAPGRQNFSQAGVYRLKLTNIPGFEGVELYPTLEIGPVTPRTRSFLAHNAIPVQFTQDDFSQVMAGNHVIKVIYLPDPDFQVLAVAGGVGTLVSTKLDPGQDPIVEADQRGAIMAVLRVGNLDLEALTAAGEPAFVDGAIVGGAGFAGGPMPSAGMAPGYVSGVTTQTYGMPFTGTPIGLPGPAHIPLGGPAGLRMHYMQNHTPIHMPVPPSSMGIHVRQQPGISYPAPANRIHVREQALHPSPRYRQPHTDRFMLLR